MFGSSNAFGSSGGGGGFGQSNQNRTSTFGGFGQSSSAANNTGGFGGAGAGGFGATSNTGGGFGNTGGFGTSSNTGGGFGSSTGGFGGTNTSAGGFGQSTQTSSLFGGGATSTFGSSVTATGTARADFEPFIDQTPAGKKESYRNICFMNVYKDFSPEELRAQDYEAGRNKADSAAATAGGSAFGQTSAVGGGFGQQNQQQSSAGFGQSTAGFGSAAKPAGFGQTSAFGSGSTATGGFGQQSSSTLGGGFGQAAKPAAGGFGSFGNTGGFGQPATSSATSGGLFGSSTANKPATSAFGTPAATLGGGFGNSGATGFGGSAAGGFGAPQQQQNTGFGGQASGSAFGQTSAAGGFGSQQPQQQQTGLGFGGQSSTFGAPKSSFGTGLFGQQPQQSTGGGLFGQSAGAGAATGGFGQSGTGATGGFGQGNTGSAFGASGGGLFGGQASNATGAGATGGGGLFGQANATAQPASSGGLFGASKPATSGGLFGNTATASTGGGLFGNAGANANTGATGGGLFGQANAGAQPAAASGGGLFGNTSTASTGGGLFGAKPAAPAGGGLFGNTGAAANAGATGGGLFGNTSSTAAGGGLFGQANNAAQPANAGGSASTGGGLFGNTSSTASGGGLFGAKPATGTGGGLFGSMSSGTSGTGFGLGFGAAQAGQQAQGTQPAQQTQGSLFGGFGQQPAQQQASALQTNQLSAQIDRQPYGFSSLFDPSKLTNKSLSSRTGASGSGSSHLTATPLRDAAAAAAAAELSASDKNIMGKKRGLSLQVLSSPHASALAGSRSRSRGFASGAVVPGGATAKRAILAKSAMPVSSGDKQAAESASASASARQSREISSGLFGRDGFLSSDAQLGHSNVKRLVIARKPSLGAAAASSIDDAASVAPAKNASPALSNNPWANAPGSVSAAAPAQSEGVGRAVPNVNIIDEGEIDDEDGDGYWMRPSLADLRAMSTQQLRSVKNFTVGRTGVGQVSFTKAVDLTTLGSLCAIAGNVVLFDDRVCTVYPDESNKPPRGQGLNVPAIISLHDCWPIDRATGESVTDEHDVRTRKHIRRLSKIEETQFIDFVNGTWIFRVEHFSRYGLDDAEVSDGDEDEPHDGGSLANRAATPAAAKGKVGVQQQGFGKATASPVKPGAQSQMGGSSAVAQSNSSSSSSSNKQQQQQRQPIANPFSGFAAITAAEKRVESFGDLDSGEETASISASSVDGDSFESASFPPPAIARPPKQLLLGGRHAESLRRAPVMRASLFAPTVPTSKRALAESLVADVERDAVRNSAVSVRSSFDSTTTTTTTGSVDGNDSDIMSEVESDVRSSAFNLPPPSKYLRTNNETRAAREKMLLKPHPYASSLSHGRSGLSADAGLMMARSFRVGFGFQGQLVYLAAKSARGVVAGEIVVDSIARHTHAAPGGLGSSVAQQLASSDSDMMDDDGESGSQSTLLDAQRSVHLSTVMAQWQHAVIVPPNASSHGSIAPAVLFRPDTTIASVIDSLQSQQPGPIDAAAQSQDRQILDLAAVLFDELPMKESGQQQQQQQQQRQRIQSVRRRQALTGWLMAAVYDSVQRDLLRASQSKSPAASAVFALLSGHRIDAACLAATSHRDYRLATLIAQCGAGAVGGGGNDQQVRQLLRAQLERFVAMGTNKDVAKEYRRVYELLSGNVHWETKVPGASSDNDKHRLFVSGGVDWKRAFALGLWYAQSPADPVSEAVASYEASFVGGLPVAPPLPFWAVSQQTNASATADLFDRGVWDPAYQLLKLFSKPSHPLESALVAESFSPARADSRLSTILAWLLWVVRGVRGFEDATPSGNSPVAGLSSMAYDRLLTSWAHQLESLGLWHWACFLLLQLSSSSSSSSGDAHKVHAIRSLIERSLQSSATTDAVLSEAGADLLDQSMADTSGSSSEQQMMISFVVNQLHLPRQWIYEACATRSRYDSDWLLERSATTTTAAAGATATLRLFAWLLRSGQICAAHTLALQRIAPDAILCGDYSLLGRVLERLNPTLSVQDSRLSLENWNSGGHVYSLFLSAVRDLPAMLGRVADGADYSDGSQVFAQIQTAYQQMLAFLAALPSLSARFNSSAALLGFYDGVSATWFTEEQSRELRVKYSVATSDMASVVTGFIQELERCVPGLSSTVSSSSSSSVQTGHSFGNNDLGFAYAAKTAALPMAQDTRILRTYQMARSYFDSFVGDQLGA
ncbi:hypothetical protein GGF40_001604 [Coemansia sp. RSA 1286]|nr:hypothetical protein GGF40_001604 [Coemansia sp. RSA 1286]